MQSLIKIGLVFGQALVVLAAFRAGEVMKAVQVRARPWDSYTTQIPPGAALNPVPLKVENRNAAVVFRGSYLVNGQQHCNFCHTCPPYAADGEPGTPRPLPTVNTVNYMAGGRRFGAANDTNAPVSANLTPDLKTGLPGGLTFNEFRTALRAGRAHQTGRQLEVMRWPMFRDLTDMELMTIYEYLRAIPHAEPGCAAQDQIALGVGKRETGKGL